MSPSEELSEPGIIGFLWRLHHAGISIIKRTGWGQGGAENVKIESWFCLSCDQPSSRNLRRVALLE